MFYDTRNFNKDISDWTVSAVTYRYMFAHAYRFNKVLSKWTLNNSVIVTDCFKCRTYHNSPTIFQTIKGF